MHSEYNASPTEHVQLLQLWVFPKQKNIKPRYDQKMFSEEGKKNKFQVVVAPDVDDALWINQDAYFSLLDTTEEQTMTYKTHKPGNGVYFFVIDGDFSIADEKLHRRDAIGVSEAEEIEIKTPASGKLLAIEVPMVA
jgi:redox-sensitive bicupin YhaK (pirin superfamily)